VAKYQQKRGESLRGDHPLDSIAGPEFCQSIQVSCADDNDIVQWNNFVGSHCNAGFFHRFEWGRLIERHLRHRPLFLIARQNDQTVGVFPIVQMGLAPVRRTLCSMPFVDYGGPLASSAEAQAHLLQYAESFAIDNNLTNFQIRSATALSDSWPSLTHKTLYTVDVTPCAEALWSNFKSKHRTTIRRAYKNGLGYVSGRHELLDDFYTVLSDSWHRLGSPLYRKSFFSAMLNTFGDDIRICIVRHNERPVAVAMNGQTRSRVDGMWLGATLEGRRLGANYVLYWEMLKEASTKNKSLFSLGRSSIDSSAESFKRKWNAHTVQLYWSYPLATDAGRITNPGDSQLISTASRIWRLCPRVITDLIGPALARHFP